MAKIMQFFSINSVRILTLNLWSSLQSRCNPKSTKFITNQIQTNPSPVLRNLGDSEAINESVCCFDWFITCALIYVETSETERSER